MLTAEEARKLMPKNKIAVLLEEVLNGIRAAAEMDKHECRLSGLLSDKDRFEWIRQYVYVGKNDGVAGKLIKELHDLGYKVRTLYEERQFVDMDIIVSWE